MSEMFHTVERAAERLAVHPKTVLRFIRDGRLRATRIGKAWRILASDLNAFAGVPSPAAKARESSARVTAIAELEDVSMDVSRRMATAMQALVLAPRDRTAPIKLDTIYDPERSHLKVVIVADTLDAAVLLQSLHGFAEAFR
ncbi:MAG TPA: helix-turn-helix domain-containing protein [Caulobacteraceae bacterium]|nr:helix-turn-helix domain-containing protein [Caulobacteraceae bacterium]